MSSIEETLAPVVNGTATDLALALFDEVIVSAASGGNTGYFPLAREPERNTYFVQPGAPKSTPADFDFPGGGGAGGLIDALVEYWTLQGANRLATSGPRLKEIVVALRAEAVESDGDVDPYCYTMF